MGLPKIRMASTLFLQKRFKPLCSIFILLICRTGSGQAVVREFDKDSLGYYLEATPVPQYKTIPPEYDSLIRIALLYYPELENVHISFRVRKQTSPLMARPTVFGVFRRAVKRRYVVAISSNTLPALRPILLKNLSLNSRIGVIGHELSHISDYNSRCGLYFVRLLFMHLSKTRMDRFEYATDMRCISHGLGYQLLSWSREVRLKLKVPQWNGVEHLHEKERERYMNPASILRAMKQYPIYYN